MTEKRLVTIAEYLNPVARREHEVQEAGLEIQAARVSLQKDIALAQFQQNGQHHADQMALRQNELMLNARRHADDMEIRKGELFQEERHHADRMNVMAQTNELRGRQLDLSEERSAAEIALGRDRLSFEEKRASLEAEVSHDTAVIQAQTSLAITAMQQNGAQEIARMGHENTITVAKVQQEGAREIAHMGHQVTLAVTEIQQNGAQEIARMGHEAAIVIAQIQGEESRALAELQGEQAIALTQLNHKQAMTLAREEAHIRTIETAGKVPYEAIASTLRKSEDTNRALSGGMATIFVERQKARLTAYLEDQQEKHRENAHRRQMEAEAQKEGHRANERGHELTMAEYSARFARVGFTQDELIAAGFSAAEAALIVSRLIDGVNPQNEDETAIFGKFDKWYKAAKS